jgi:hypothetical protein
LVRGQFANPEEGKRPPLEADTRGLVETQIEKTVCVLQLTVDSVEP